ncbi:MAG: prepilin-type N-terminal cleavage/methylation domain-containing protein [Deltaproteobacteria bacterium]|nr:prepilin-type N-terminal cleavage/methylation domain-containing protein [Deltaproteobacteria bacterium]
MHINMEKMKLSACNGFTLLELVLVMVIVCTMLGIAAPSLRGFFASRRTHDASSQIIAMTRHARSQAIVEGRIYRLNLDTGEGSYWLTVMDQGVFRKLFNEFGRTFLVPDGTEIELEKENEDISQQYVDFFQNGSTETGTIRLTDRRGDVYEITCASPSEQYFSVIQEEE